jgi:hypothetical protein
MRKTAQRLQPLLLTALASCVATGQLATDRQAVMPLRLDCRMDESAPLDFAQLVAAPGQYMGRCVHARGVIAFRRFYPDASSLYSARSPAELVAVYGEDSSEDGESLWVARKPVELVGYTYTCEEYARYADASIEAKRQAARARGENYAAMALITGECHNRGGPALFVSRWKTIKGESNRLSGREAAERYGDMFEMDQRWPYAVEVQSIAKEWFRLLRTQDTEGLQTLLRLERVSDESYSDEMLMRHYTHSAESPYAALFGAADSPIIKYFQTGVPYGSRAGDYQAYGCACKSADCEDDWPIHSQDTEPADAEWPYICVRIGRYEGRLSVGPF